MWTIPYLVSVLCMQKMARHKKKLEVPLASNRKLMMERRMVIWAKNHKEEREEFQRKLGA